MLVEMRVDAYCLFGLACRIALKCMVLNLEVVRMMVKSIWLALFCFLVSNNIVLARMLGNISWLTRIIPMLVN